jgi:peptidoglycan/LPS O-acetylase OafA/YrhL
MPTFSEIYPIVLVLIAFLTTGWLVLRRYPMPEDEKARDIQIDGLRALLALGVMYYHYFGIRHLIYSGELAFDRTSKITQLLGTWTVPIFFGITAYLFSQRLTRYESHQGRSTVKFLVGRFFRLVPTSLLACLLFLLINIKVYADIGSSKLLLYNFEVLVNAALASILFPAPDPHSQLVSQSTWIVACGPQWTLHYEWMFYLTLASISIVTFKKQSVVLPVIVVIFMAFGIQGTHDFFQKWDESTWAFIPGLILGLTHRYWKNNKYLSHPLTAAVAMTAVLASAFYDKLKVKIPANTLFLAVVLSSNRATRILESRLLRSLGETTYSVYMLHGLVQYATLKWIVTIPMARSIPEWLWWMTCALQVVAIVIIARLSFEYVEKPGIEAGKRFYTWLMNGIERRAKWLLNWM